MNRRTACIRIRCCAWNGSTVSKGSKVTKLGTQLLSVGARLRYWVASPETGPHGWGGRVFVTLLFPKR